MVYGEEISTVKQRVIVLSASLICAIDLSVDLAMTHARDTYFTAVIRYFKKDSAFKVYYFYLRIEANDIL